MTYIIRWSNKNGGTGMRTVLDNEKAKEILVSLFIKRKPAKVEKNGAVIGECYKRGTKWNWYLDITA